MSKLRYLGRRNFVFNEELYTTPGARCGQFLRVEEVLFEADSACQHIAIFLAERWGKVLALDGVIQATTLDERIYHEVMVHPAIHWFKKNAGAWPEVVAVIGGGDGGVLREVRRYPKVLKMIMREIDPVVIEATRRFIPEFSDGAFDDQRLEGSVIGDGWDFVHSAPPGSADVLIVDSSDPVGPAERLFSVGFHHAAHRVLSPNGIYVRQTGSPMLQPSEWVDAFTAMRRIFRRVEVYFPSVPTYYGGLFSICVASKVGTKGPARIFRAIEEQLWYLSSARLSADRKPPKFLCERVHSLK